MTVHNGWRERRCMIPFALVWIEGLSCNGVGRQYRPRNNLHVYITGINLGPVTTGFTLINHTCGIARLVP